MNFLSPDANNLGGNFSGKNLCAFRPDDFSELIDFEASSNATTGALT